ncbi:MAG: HI0074 family nucleotidyltransferase substrate-binding subunit [Lachnospiraceae bacterium]|nr:HI0074 family nucleotidyltransferase substrate-binding subunit [Lachnospiraceae bacterium]
MKKYDNYASHLSVLSRAKDEDLSNEFVVSGIIDKFFIQFELGWKLFQRLLRYEGNPVGRSGSPRDILKEAYRTFAFLDEERWLSMLEERNTVVHIYDKETADRLVRRIIKDYIPEFARIQEAIAERYGESLDGMS